MKKFLALLLICLALLPALAFAYEFLQPLPGMDKSIESGKLSSYFTWLYKFALGVAAFLALLHIVIGGIMIMVGGASETSRASGKKMIENAIWGLLLAISAWLILYTINPDLVNKGFCVPKIIPGQVIKGCGEDGTSAGGNSGYNSDYTQDGLSNIPSGIYSGTSPTSSWSPTPAYSETEARNILNQANIGVKDECPVDRSTGCVSLDGIKQSTINEVLNLAQGVGASNIYITGGTEDAHTAGLYSHTNGYKVDLDKDPELTNYIKSNYESIGTRSDGAKQYKSPDGAIYALESDHWDVLVVSI